MGLAFKNEGLNRVPFGSSALAVVSNMCILTDHGRFCLDFLSFQVKPLCCCAALSESVREAQAQIFTLLLSL